MKTTPNFNKAELYLYNYLKSQGFTLRVGQIKDFRLDENESENFIEGWAQDWIDERSQDTDDEYTSQDEYDERNAYGIRQGEMIERFRNEY